jgi:hypothetical protein
MGWTGKAAVLGFSHVTGWEAIGACKVMGLAGSETTPLALPDPAPLQAFAIMR